MNKVNFLNYERFIADSETWDFVQQMINLTAKLTALGGGSDSNYIVSGCSVIGTTVAPGVVVIAGELMPFAGGTLAENVIVNETTESVTWGAITNNDLYVRREAIFGSGAGHKWSEFVRVKNLTELTAHIANKDNPHGVTKAQVGLGNIPNAISNAINLNSSDTLATSRAVKTLADMLPIGSGAVYIGDIGVDFLKTITFPNVGTSSYIVMGSWKSTEASWNADNDILGWVWYSPTSTSFKISISETSTAVQKLTFNYLLFKI